MVRNINTFKYETLYLQKMHLLTDISLLTRILSQRHMKLLVLLDFF